MDVGDVLADRYELREEVGAGGMGRVLRAHDRTLDRPVAVKLLAPHLLGDADAVAALRDEARRAASVRHPNVVQVLDAVLEDTDQPAIVMEYVDGPSLRDAVPADGMELDDALQVIAAVGSGLAAVHAAGLVHRDVTPGNVLLDHGVPRLTDFGIARSAAATATQTIRGSVGYLAPEQARGDAVGPSADLYALGCLAMTLLTGRPPFAADVPVGVVHQHLHQDPPDVRERRPDVPAAVAVTIAAALAKDPAQRPPSASAMVRTLGMTTTSAPVGTGGTPDGPDLPVTTVIAGGGADAPVDGTRVLGAVPSDGPPQEPALDETEVVTDGTDGAPRTLLAALAAVAVLAVLAGVLALGSGDPTQVAAIPGASAAPSAAPIASQSPSPAPPAPPPLSPEEAALAALQDLRALLVDLHGAGELSEEGLEKLDERAAKALEKLDEGEPNDAAKELRELRKELGGRIGKDEVSGSAADAILTQLLEAEAALDAVPRNNGDNGPPGDRGRDEDDD